MRHGPVDVITPPEYNQENNKKKPSVKECPECNAIIHAGFKTCPFCGFEFPVRESSSKLYTTAADESILSGETEVTDYQVFETNYDIHEKEREDGSISYSIKIEYRVALHIWKRDFVFPESTNPFARNKFVEWWDQHVCPELQSTRICPPTTCEDFMDYANWGCIADAKEITITKVAGVKYPRVTGFKLKEIPSYDSIRQKIQEAQEAPQHQYGDYDGYGY